MNQQRLIPAALLASSVFEGEVHDHIHQPAQQQHQHDHHHPQIVAVVCTNDHIGGGAPDTGCPATAPICVDSSGQKPALGEQGSDCAPCINYYENPAEADWGCSSSEPLCVVQEPDATAGEETESINNHERPEFGMAGTACIPYPCHNTQASPGEPDAGCTASHPTCVDGLGNDPPLNQPGVQCVAYEEPAHPSVTAIPVFDNDDEDASQQGSRVLFHGSLSIPSAWGLVPNSKRLPNQKNGRENSKKKDDEKGCWNTTGQFSSCTGCPFSQPKIVARPCALGRLSW